MPRAECGSVFDNKGKQNSMLSVKINMNDKLKLIRVDMNIVMYHRTSCVLSYIRYAGNAPQSDKDRHIYRPRKRLLGKPLARHTSKRNL